MHTLNNENNLTFLRRHTKYQGIETERKREKESGSERMREREREKESSFISTQGE